MKEHDGDDDDDDDDDDGDDEVDGTGCASTSIKNTYKVTSLSSL